MFYSLTSIYRANIYRGLPYTNPIKRFLCKIVWMIIINIITVPLYIIIYRAILPSPERHDKWRFDRIIFKIRESDLVIEYVEFVFYLDLHILHFPTKWGAFRRHHHLAHYWGLTVSVRLDREMAAWNTERKRLLE